MPNQEKNQYLTVYWWIRVVTDEGDQQLIGWSRILCAKMMTWYQKGVGLRDQMIAYLEMSLMGMWKTLNIVINLAWKQNKENNMNWTHCIW